MANHDGSPCPSCQQTHSDLHREVVSLQAQVAQLARIEACGSDGRELQSSIETIKATWSESLTVWKSNCDQHSRLLSSIDQRLRALEAHSALIAKRQTQIEQELHQANVPQTSFASPAATLEKQRRQVISSEVVIAPATSTSAAVDIEHLQSRVASLEAILAIKALSVRRRRRRQPCSASGDADASSAASMASTSSLEDPGGRVAAEGVVVAVEEDDRGVLTDGGACSMSSGWSEESFHGLEYSSG